MIRAVIDTNVLVSAMISSAGNEALVVMAINQKLVRPCFSPEILKEYSEVLLRPKFAFSADEVDTMLGLLGRCGHRLKPVSVSRVSTDPGDDKFIACALSAKADFLVTGNKRHFSQSKLADTKVVNAGELLEVIALEL